MTLDGIVASLQAMPPPVLAAFIALAGVLLSALVSRVTTMRVAHMQAEAAEKAAEKQQLHAERLAHMEQLLDDALQKAKERHERQIAELQKRVAQEVAEEQRAHEVRLKHLEDDLAVRRTVTARELDEHFAHRKAVRNRIDDLRASMYASDRRLQTLRRAALHLDDEATVNETSELLRAAAIMMGNAGSPPLPEPYRDALAAVRARFTEVVLYLVDEKQHRVVDGDAGAWQAELERRIQGFEAARAQFVEISDGELDSRIEDLARQVDARGLVPGESASGARCSP